MDISNQYKDLNSVSLYADFKNLNQLKNSAKNNDKQALQEVTKQFEAIMLQTLLKSVREGNRVFGESLFGTEQTHFFEDLFDQQLALGLSGEGFGLAKMLQQQLDPTQENSLQKSAPPSHTKNLIDLIDNSRFVPITQDLPETDLSNIMTNEFKSPSEFVNKLWGMAKHAAQEIAIDPKILLAQAALETGWGKFIAKHESGKSSFNLFGIKANAASDVDKTLAKTVEYEGNEMKLISALFKSYGSHFESFMDYIQVLKHSRYETARNNSHDASQFLQELQRAGYATDPQYANKILSILKSDVFNNITS